MNEQRTHKIEERSFKLHEDTLKSVIMQQAGTLEKAFMELIMNSVDAGANRIDIKLKDDYFEIKDDGRGFNGREEILAFFETFGTPHEDGDAEYGRFRMGRGQIMPFAKTTWRSDRYSMVTDLRNSKETLGYTLVEHEEKENGCVVSGYIYPEVFKSISNQFKLEHTIPKNIKFVKTPIYLNDVRINIDPSDYAWDYETDEAYFKVNLESREIHLYNLGVFVSSKNSYNYYGIGGVVVSKQALNVNFARNDVIAHECAIYTKIEEKLRSIVAEKEKKAKRLNYSEKKYYVDFFLFQEIDLVDFADKYVFTLLNNKSITLSDFKATTKNKLKIALAEPWLKNEAEYCMNKNIVTVFKSEILELFEVDSLQAFFDKLRAAIERLLAHPSSDRDIAYRNSYIGKQALQWLDAVKIVDLAEYTNIVDSNHTIVKHKNLTKKEQLILKAIKTKNNAIMNLAGKVSGEPISPRTIFVGESARFEGWTDGQSYIVINRSMLENADFGITGLTKIFAVVLHEYFHTDFNTSESHPHNLEFYQNFHNAILDTPQHESIAELARAAVRGYYLSLEESKIKIPKKVAEDSMYSEVKYNNAMINSFFGRLDHRRQETVTIEDISSMKEIARIEPFWFGMNSRLTVDEVVSSINYYIQTYFKMKAMIEVKLSGAITLIGPDKLSSFVDYLILNSRFLPIMRELNKNNPDIQAYEHNFLRAYKIETHPLLSYFLESKKKVLAGQTRQG